MTASIAILPGALPRSPRMTLPSQARVMILELVCDFATTGSTVYELGHTIEELLPALHARMARHVRLPSFDSGASIQDACAAILVGSSLQVHPLRRPQLLANIYRGLNAGGCALMVEVVRSRDSMLNNLFSLHAHETSAMMQMAGTLDDEVALVRQCGFRSAEIFYRHYGLCGLIAIK